MLRGTCSQAVSLDHDPVSREGLCSVLGSKRYVTTPETAVGPSLDSQPGEQPHISAGQSSDLI